MQWYKKAERLGHDLQDEIEPEDEFAYASAASDAAGPRPSDETVEFENTLRLAAEDEEKLRQSGDDALSYKFTDEQREFLETNGYLVLKNVVPHDICDEMVRECFEGAHKLFGVTRSDHKTWSPLEGGGFIDIWHAPAYYKLRQVPALYSIFAQLLREPKLTGMLVFHLSVREILLFSDNAWEFSLHGSCMYEASGFC